MVRAATLLLRRSSEADVEALTKLASSPHAELRLLAARALVGAEREEAFALLSALLQDHRPAIRVEACTLCSSYLDRRCVDPLMERLKDAEETVRQAAARALEAIAFYETQRASWVRRLRATALDPAFAAARLLDQARSRAPVAVRAAAIRSLGVLGVPEVLPDLIDWLQDDEESIREAARAAIDRLHEK